MKYLDSWKRWVVWLLLACLFAVACVALSQWQFNRRAEAVSRIQLIEENFNQPPVALEDISTLDAFDSKFEWRPVQLSGSFVPEQAVLVRNRPLNGQPGFLQLVPFRLDSGELIAVETGWLPTGSMSDSPDQVPLPQGSATKVIGRLRPVEPTLGRSAPTGQIATINVDSLIEKVSVEGEFYSAAYARLDGSYNSGMLPKPMPRPALTEGSHLSYAFQWLLFAAMGFGVLTWAVRQEIQIGRQAADPSYKPKRRKKFGDEDKLAEDAING